MVAWAIANEPSDFSSLTLTVVEILPDASTSTPSTSFKPSSLSSISSTTTTATKSKVNSLPSQISTSKPLISSVSSSSPSVSSVSSSVRSPSSSISSFSSSVPSPSSSVSSSSSTLSPSASSVLHSSQITKSLSASSSLNSGAIAGIVIACVVISLIGTFFAIRVWSRKRASKLRKNWVRSFVGVEPFYETPGNVEFREPGLSVQIPSPQVSVQIPSPQVSVEIPSPHVSLPPISYNNDAIFQHSTSPVTLSPFASASPVYLPGLMTLSPYSTTVVCAFIPSLPDELTIFVGETLRVLAGYKDEWSLCMDCRGKQGMVPNECLDESPSSMGLLPPNNDFRVSKNSTRVSSLAQGVRHVHFN